MGNKQHEALIAVKKYLEDEDWDNPFYRAYEDGDRGLGETEDGTIDWQQVIALASETDDRLAHEALPVLDLYRQVVDALTPDGGEARKASHQWHWFAGPDGEETCVRCGERMHHE